MRLPANATGQTMELKGSRTAECLRTAFAYAAQAHHRYAYFAHKADVEGYNDVAALFRATADSETGHAHGQLEYLEAVGDPITALTIATTVDNLRAAIVSEREEHVRLYPEMATIARAEGFMAIADWFDTLAQTEATHVQRFQHALTTLESVWPRSQ